MAIKFSDGSTSDYTPPHNTGDPRYKACEYHHPACACREAFLAEEVREYRTEYQAYRDAINAVVGQHQTFDDDMNPLCLCTGCQIVQVVDRMHRARGEAIREAKAAQAPPRRPIVEEEMPF